MPMKARDPIRVVVTGGREYADARRMSDAFEQLARRGPLILICGMARGADMLAWRYARSVGWKTVEFPADWEKYGKAAGVIRNQQMINAGCPHVCVAFPGGRGTADMVRRCRAAGVEIIEVAAP